MLHTPISAATQADAMTPIDTLLANIEHLTKRAATAQAAALRCAPTDLRDAERSARIARCCAAELRELLAGAAP